MSARENSAVAVVVDRRFGERLNRLAERFPVWIVTSEANRPVVEALWARHKDRRAEHEITVYNADVGSGEEALLLSQIDAIDLHHPSWLTIEVYGVPRSPYLTEIFQKFGVTEFQDRLGGFIALRPEPTA